jgi:DNA replication ATP-dependent helicase Dna2
VPVNGAPADADDADEEPFLPPTLDDERMCGRFYALDTASLIAAAYAHKTCDLSRVHGVFFRRWERLLAHEEAGTSRHRAEL